MNLTSLRERIKNVIDYSPDLQGFNDQLDQLINDAYLQIWTHKRWTFATKTIPYRFYIDILPTRDNENVIAPATAVGASWFQGERRVEFDASIDRLVKVGNLDASVIWEGAYIQIDNYEYRINKILSGKFLLVDEPIKAPRELENVTWEIKKRFYDIPEDCLELLYLGHRDYPFNTNAGSYPPFGKATGLLPRREEQVNLRADYKASYAEAYIPSPAFQVAPAEKLSLALRTETGGNLNNEKYYEFCWAFEKDGKIGSLSEPATIKTNDTNNTIRFTFTSWDGNQIVSDAYNSNDENPTPWEGYRKVIFYNKNFNQTTGERSGLPCWIQIINGGSTRNVETFNEPVVVSDLTSTYDLFYINQMDNGSKRYIEIDGQWQQIRPYPRVDGFDIEIAQAKDESEIITQYHDFVRDGVIRYYKKPLELLLSTDSPELPFEFHQLIVYKALENIYLKVGQPSLAATYSSRYEKEIKELQKRYCDRIDANIVRGQFGPSQGSWRFDANSLKRLN